MLKEYIQNLQSENDRKIGSLEKEMHELVNDLSCAEQMKEELEREKKLDTNIFSPRAMNQKIDGHIAKKQEEISQLKQRMEYVTQMIEDGIKNREEYRKLEQELCEEQFSSEKEPLHTDGLSDSGDSADLKASISAENSASLENCLDAEKTAGNSNSVHSGNTVSKENPSDAENFTDSESSEIAEESTVSENNVCSAGLTDSVIDNEKNQVCEADVTSYEVNKDEFLSFLNTVYHKTETSLAFLNGNKNRCRSELRSCMKLIRDYAQKVENG